MHSDTGGRDLHALSGLAITADNAALELRFDVGISAPAPVRCRAEELRSVLRDPEAATGSNAALYTVYRGVVPDEASQEIGQRGLLYTALLARAGRVGDEWVRTRGHANSPAPGTSLAFPEVHEVWQGRALLYLQAAAPGVTDVIAIELGPGDKAVVPPGWASLLANIGGEALALGSWRARDCVPQYDALRAHGGMAHYILAAKPAGAYRFEPNTHYQGVPAPRTLSAQDFPEFGLHKGEPMFTTFRRNPDFFRFMTRPQDYEHVWTTLYH